MSKQQLNLTTTNGIQIIDDYHAENFSGGAFEVRINANYEVGNMRRAAGEAVVDVPLANADQMGVTNVDENAGQPGATGDFVGI